MRANLLNAALAFVFSILIWTAVGAQLSEDVKNYRGIMFVIEVPPDVTINWQGRIYTRLEIPIEVDARGPREVVTRLGPNDLAAGLRLDHGSTELKEALTLPPGETRRIMIQDHVHASRSRLEILEARVAGTGAAQVEVSFSLVVDWLAQLKRPYETVGTPAQGFKVGKVSPNRSHVTVFGPEAVRKSDPGPYAIEPVNVEGARGGDPIQMQCKVRTPQGVRSDVQILVTVEIVPDPQVEMVVFPVRVLLPETRDHRVEPLELVATPRSPATDWTLPIPLRGSTQALRDLRNRLRAVTPIAESNLPVAYVKADELPKRPGEVDDVDIFVVGLPEGVTYGAGKSVGQDGKVLDTTVKFPVIMKER